MSIKTKEIKKLFEADPSHFDGNLQKVFGVQESETRRTIDPQAARDLNNLSPAKLARDFLGENYADQLVPHLKGNPSFFCRVRGMEAEGGPVTASLMSPINLWTAGVLGLYDAKVLEGYNLPEFAFRQLTREVPTVVPGGHKHIRAAYDGTLPTKALQERESAPVVGAAPAWIWTQSCETHQIQTSLTMEAMLSDITGMLQSAAVTVGKATAKNENDRGLDVIYGRTNTYCYNATSNIPNTDTYYAASAANGLLAAAAAPSAANPINFINAGTGAAYALTDHLVLNQAWLTLNQNFDPVTGWRFVPKANLKLVVGPDLLLQAEKIKKQLGAWQRLGNLGDVGTSPTTGTYREEATGSAVDLLPFTFEIVNSTYQGIDRLATLGSHNATTGGTVAKPSFANASNSWLLMNPDGFEYQVLRPIATNTYPLTGDEMAQRIVFRGDAMVMSRFVVVDPRNAFLALPY